jgi:DME family drug/metabolite transporter
VRKLVQMKAQFSGYSQILIAATLWGTLGLFYKYLNSTSHLAPVEIVFWRALIAAVITFVVVLIQRRKDLLIHKEDIALFLGIGTIGIAGFYIIYISAITQIGMGIASVLLYSAPIWVAIYGILVQGDRLNSKKVLALVLSISGSVLIAGIYNMNQFHMSIWGLLIGLGAGIGYAAYILLNKQLTIKGYSTWTVNAYGLGIGSLILLLFQDISQMRITITTPSLSIWLLLLGVLPTLGGGLAFYSGLQKIPAVNASIVATFEPFVATVLGWWVFSEELRIPQVLGGILILSSVILIQLPGRKITGSKARKE